MHIADATLLFAPRSGGVRRYLRCKQNYLKSIPTMRHTLVVPGPVDRQTPGLVEIASPRIPFAGGYRLPLRPWVWRDQLCRIAPDLVEAGDPYHPAWSVLAAAQRLGIPSVAFVHSNLSRMLASQFGKWAGHAAERYLRSLYDGFDVILAASATVARDLSAAGISRVEIQRLGVDANTFHPAKRDNDLRFLLGLPANTRLLAFAGRLAREKSIDLMRAAVESLGPRYHLLLIGAREKCRRSACVTELPYQHDARQLARLLASADALLHAGQQETFGLVVLEAMACGRPVVGIQAGAVAELVDNGVGRLAETGCVESLRRAIVDLYDADIDALGIEARRRVERTFTWPQVFASQLARYARITRSQSDLVPAPSLAEQLP